MRIAISSRTLLTASMVILLSGLLPFVAGCGSKQERAADSMISLMSDAADVLAKVKSKSDVASAKSDLKSIGEKIKVQAEEASKLPPPTAEETKAIEDKYKDKLMKVIDRISAEEDRIGKDVGADAVRDLRDAMDSAEFKSVK